MPEPFEEESRRWKNLMQTFGRWTWVIWDERGWRVYRQVPDPRHDFRVLSTEVASGGWSIPWSEMPCPGKPGCDYAAEYSAKQLAVGRPYATQEYPLVLLGGLLGMGEEAV